MKFKFPTHLFQLFARRSAVIAALCMLTCYSCFAQAENSGITVIGSGTAKGKPTEVEIAATVSGEAELTNDAMVKFRDAKKRALAAVEAMKIKDLQIEPNGLSVGQAMDPNMQQQMMRGGGMAAVGKPKIQISENLKITLKNVDKLEPGALMDTLMKIIDNGRDAGLGIGPQINQQNYYQYQQQAAVPMLNFKIVEPRSLRDEAYKQAIDDAKSKAQKLADLAGVKLGKIINIHDQAVQPQNVYNPYYGYQQVQSDPSELSNQLLADIPMKVSLTVKFEIQK